MDQRIPTLSLTALLCLAGCAAEGGVVVYDTTWDYGATSTRRDPQGDPFFVDGFTSTLAGAWTMNVTSQVTRGTFEIHVRGPDGKVTGLAHSDGDYPIEGTEGLWSIEILTDTSDDGTPTGSLRLRIST